MAGDLAPGNSSGLNIDTANSTSHCSTGFLLGPFGLFVQALLALVAFSSLIVKRYLEPKQSRRSWIIWFFDTSKQAVGAMLIHLVNVLLSDVFKGDPCTWYIISFLLDSSLGLLLMWALLKLCMFVIIKNDWRLLYFGQYSTHKYMSWAGQCLVYLCVMIISKLIITALMQFHFWSKVRHVIMSPIKDPRLELVIVMFIIPVIVNALIFWVVDNFLMRSLRVPSAKQFKSPAVQYAAPRRESDCEIISLGVADDADDAQLIPRV